MNPYGASPQLQTFMASLLLSAMNHSAPMPNPFAEAALDFIRENAGLPAMPGVPQPPRRKQDWSPRDC